VTSIAHATGQHDGLVIRAAFAVYDLLECAKVPEQIRPAEFVVECRAADRALEHDLQRGCDTPWSAVILTLPWLFESGYTQM